MPRPTSIAWRYFEKVTGTDGHSNSTNAAKCSFCSGIFETKPLRMKHHLIYKCPKIPRDVADSFKVELERSRESMNFEHKGMEGLQSGTGSTTGGGGSAFQSKKKRKLDKMKVILPPLQDVDKDVINMGLDSSKKLESVFERLVEFYSEDLSFDEEMNLMNEGTEKVAEIFVEAQTLVAKAQKILLDLSLWAGLSNSSFRDVNEAMDVAELTKTQRTILVSKIMTSKCSEMKPLLDLFKECCGQNNQFEMGCESTVNLLRLREGIAHLINALLHVRNLMYERSFSLRSIPIAQPMLPMPSSEHAQSPSQYQRMQQTNPIPGSLIPVPSSLGGSAIGVHHGHNARASLQYDNSNGDEPMLLNL